MSNNAPHITYCMSRIAWWCFFLFVNIDVCVCVHIVQKREIWEMLVTHAASFYILSILFICFDFECVTDGVSANCFGSHVLLCALCVV